LTSPLAVIFALGAAALFGLGNALEHRVVFDLPTTSGVNIALLARLARSREWLVGYGADIGAFGLHAAALGFGGLLFVQPLLCSGLLFALLLSARWSGRRLGRREWVHALLLCAGLATFLIAAAPSGGVDHASAARWLTYAVPVAFFSGACVVGAVCSRGHVRAALFGCSAGATFGISAALTKTFVSQIQRGVPYTASHWEVYALATASIVGLLLTQNGFQAESLSASLPGLEAMEPITAVILGVLLFDERIQGSGNIANALIGLSLLVMIYSVVRLAGFAGSTLREPSAIPSFVGPSMQAEG
jgi:drug/metabolite transporter (DMT)-like permease